GLDSTYLESDRILPLPERLVKLVMHRHPTFRVPLVSGENTAHAAPAHAVSDLCPAQHFSQPENNRVFRGAAGAPRGREWGVGSRQNNRRAPLPRATFFATV